MGAGSPLKPEREKNSEVLLFETWMRASVIAISLLLLSAVFFSGNEGKNPQDSSGQTAQRFRKNRSRCMPFENLSRDHDNAYFADGIQDEILTRLSKIADLKVISRTSTQHYKSAPENLSEIGRQLGVAHILEGSVQKSGDAVRVNVQLIKAANDSHLWADTFDRKLTDIFSVESEVAKAIAEQLRAKLTGQEEQVIAAKPTENVRSLRRLPPRVGLQSENCRHTRQRPWRTEIPEGSGALGP